MGTRSTITFKNKCGNKETTYVTIYQQYDGYIDGVGHDLARWLLKKKIVNGFRYADDDMSDTANGLGCLAAQFIHDFKVEIGGLYITTNDDREDYNYFVLLDNSKLLETYDHVVVKANDCITITVTNFDEEKPIFVGTPSELLKFKEEEE